MKTAFASLNLAVLLALGVASAAQAQAPAPSPAYSARIGWVSSERLFTESQLARKADARIEEEFSKRQKAMQDQIGQFKSLSEKFDADNAKLSEIERTRRTRELVDMEKDLQRKQREFREDLAQRKNDVAHGLPTRAGECASTGPRRSRRWCPASRGRTQ